MGHSGEVSHLPAEAHLVERIGVSADAVVYPEGWQSWTPTDFYPIRGTQHRPVNRRQFQLGYRGDRAEPSGLPGEFVADGLLAIADPGSGVLHVVSATDPASPVRLSAEYRNGLCVVRADGEVSRVSLALESSNHLDGADPRLRALADWATGRHWAPQPREAPTVWCSWYQYFAGLTQTDVSENLQVMAELGLNFDVVQIDDGYQREIGDWLEPSPRFSDLSGLVSDIRRNGRRAGMWVAPWLVGERSHIAAEHPEWLLRDQDGELVCAGFNWGQSLWVLDTTHAQASAHLLSVVQSFVDIGVDYLKLDFLYAGALPGIRADGSGAVSSYRAFLGALRQWFPNVYVVACGAPILPSIGLVDAMRVSPDTAPHEHPSQGDFSAPGQISAMMTGRARRWQHSVWWTNDPDCLLARPGVESRDAWADYLAETPGLRGCSDRLRALDAEGLNYTIRHLACATIQP